MTHASSIHGSTTLPGSSCTSVLLATVGEGDIALSSDAGDLVVTVPLDDEPGTGATSPDAGPAVSVVCALDTALARRLFRRVSAWHVEDDGRLTARVRPAL